jgi:aspartyl-tRNA(Asn)/glutamyl-tRNA(Gln) amidotransferase subunit A
MLNSSMPASPPETIASAQAALRTRKTTGAELVERSLQAIERHQATTNAFITIHADGAREDARRADADLSAGRDRGPLHGIPISLKDLIDVRNEVTTAASRVLRDRVAEADAPIVTRLRDAGAIVIGRTNLHEFALGTTSEESAFGPVRHPADSTRVAGGSSGGSAAAVATGMGLASIGTDTGGSIRIPAAACGVVGLKPSIGEVPTDGIIPLSTSLDHAGPIALTVEDAGILWRVLTGQPATSRDTGAITLVRLGGYFDVMAPDVRDPFERALDALATAGITMANGTIDDTGTIVKTYVDVVLPEAAAWHAPYLDSRADDYTPNVRARLLAGRDIRAVDYVAAQRQRESLRAAVDAVLAGGTAIVLPALPIVAPLLGAGDLEIDRAAGITLNVRAAMLRNTQLFNLTGHPAISIPVPVDVAALPVGLHIVGRLRDTAGLLAVASACEKILSSP